MKAGGVSVALAAATLLTLPAQATTPQGQGKQSYNWNQSQNWDRSWQGRNHNARDDRYAPTRLERRQAMRACARALEYRASEMSFGRAQLSYPVRPTVTYGGKRGKLIKVSAPVRFDGPRARGRLAVSCKVRRGRVVDLNVDPIRIRPKRVTYRNDRPVHRGYR